MNLCYTFASIDTNSGILFGDTFTPVITKASCLVQDNTPSRLAVRQHTWEVFFLGEGRSV